MTGRIECPFELGEIAVFNSGLRFETYIAQIQSVHIEFWGSGFLPQIKKATDEQKATWYESEETELVIKSWL